MQSRFSFPRLNLSTPATGAVLGVITGIVDSIIHESWVHFQSAPLEPLLIVFTWVVVCCTAGVVFSSQRLGKLRWVPLTFAGPGLLLLSRGATAFKEMTGWSSPRILMAWFVATLLISIPLSLIPLRKTIHAPACIAATLFGIGLWIFMAADIRLLDWISPGAQEVQNTRNVLLVFLDTHRADDALGSPPAMPHLASFAAKAVTFTSAWAPASWTVPSHFAVFTGANWWRVPSDPQHGFEYDKPRLAEKFKSHGYYTGAIFANPLLSAEAGFAKGFDEFTTSRESGVCHSGLGDLLFRVFLNDGPRMPLCGWFKASEVTARAQRFIGRAHRPYMLAVNYLDTHDPYYVPAECRPAGFQIVRRPDREALIMAAPGNPQPSASVVSRYHAQYRLAMTCVDRSLGSLLQTAAQDPNTVIAVVGDHGEEFLEHGHGGHGLDVYREAIQVPLLLRVPGITAQRVTAPVSTSDLYLSLLRAANITRNDLPLPLLDPHQRRPVVSMYDFGAPSDPTWTVRGVSVVSGDYHLIFWPGGREVLFNDRLDPAEAAPIVPLAMPTVADPLRQIAIRAARDKRRAMTFSAVGYMR